MINAMEWICYGVLPTGYKLWALRQMKAAAAGHKWAEDAIEQVEQGVIKTQKLERGWRTSRKVRAGRRPLVKEIDPQVDRCLSALYNITEQLRRTMPASSAIGQAAHVVISNYFPDGVGSLTKQVAVEELADAEAILEGLRHDHAAEAALLGLEPVLAQLEALLPDYANALGVTSARDVTFPQLQNSRSGDQDAICLLIARLITRAADKPADAPISAALLGHLRTTLDTFAAARAAGKNADVNPDTGEILPDDTQA